MFRLLFMPVIFVMFLSLNACVDTTSDEPGGDDPQVNINKFSEEVKNASEYSYTIVMTSVDKTNNTTETFTYKYAKSGKLQAFSMESNDDGETIFLTTESFLYMITISNEGKSAIKMLKDEDISEEPNLFFLTEFSPSYDFQKKTENVMVGSIKTTCYEYKFLGIVYKYYLTQEDLVVKVSYEVSDSSWSYEIKNFKTSHVDQTILTIPTESAGYTIIDYTTY